MTIAADFYPKTARIGSTLVVYVIEDGNRRHVRSYPVEGKREARKLAAFIGAEPWNF